MSDSDPNVVWLRPSTVGEFDVRWGVYLQDPYDLPDGWIDIIYEEDDDAGKQGCKTWAETQGYVIIPDPSFEDQEEEADGTS